MTHLVKALLSLEFTTKDQHFAKEVAFALFEYFHLAGYLSPALINQAIDYLALEKAFAKETATVKQHLLEALPKEKEPLKGEVFLEAFAKQDYFSIGDIVELIVFLQQTAFDRNFGVERDRLTAKPWMEMHAAEFIRCANLLDVIKEQAPQRKQYIGVGIMGAASFRSRSRLEYFKSLSIESDEIWALSGDRELSKGLDEENLMKELAQYLQKEEVYVKKTVGKDTREYLSGITETQMLNYLIHKICPDKKIGLLDSKKQEGHWRATTSQNATDIVKMMLDRIIQNKSVKEESLTFHFLIIAEQPYPNRMARQVQRAFDLEIQKRKIPVKMIVEGCGQGIDKEVLAAPEKHLPVLARINSELGSSMAERYNDAKMNEPALFTRSPNILMFSKRNEHYEKLQKEKEKEKEGSSNTVDKNQPGL